MFRWNNNYFGLFLVIWNFLVCRVENIYNIGYRQYYYLYIYVYVYSMCVKLYVIQIRMDFVVLKIQEEKEKEKEDLLQLCKFSYNICFVVKVFMFEGWYVINDLFIFFLLKFGIIGLFVIFF